MFVIEVLCAKRFGESVVASDPARSRRSFIDSLEIIRTSLPDPLRLDVESLDGETVTLGLN